MVDGVLKVINDFSVAIAEKTNQKNATIEITLPSDMWRRVSADVRQIIPPDELQHPRGREELTVYCAFGILRIREARA